MLDQLVLNKPLEEMTKPSVHHQPVMMKEVLEYLNPQSGGIYVDGTLGLGGHSQEILNALGSEGRLIAIDKDPRSLKKAEENLKGVGASTDLVHNDFRNIDEVLQDLNISSVDGILLDLGISSFQLDDAKRGFSFAVDGPLDMRMDQTSKISAFDLVNSLSEHEIGCILRDFGEERWHQRIARHLVSVRNQKPIESTRELRRAILQSLPFKRSRQKIHPATRTFQAIRIAVNRELESVQEAIGKMVECLNVRGRLVIISFHSLEDRIVKQQFKELDKSGKINILTKKPLRPTDQETEDNPRARSARLRVAEKI